MSDGIEKWIKQAPESWAKLAKGAKKKTTFTNFKKKFFNEAENQNKSYLKKYLGEQQLRYIYEQGLGGTIGKKETTPTPIKRNILVMRNNKQYTRQTQPHWGLETKYVLYMAAKAKPRSNDYKRFLGILIEQGRTKQAATKKIQRTRRMMENENE